MMQEQDALCSDAQIEILVDSLRNDESEGLRTLDALLTDHAGDPRLHFLKGSLLAGSGNFPAAVTAMRHAVDLAPGYDLARFQLGFLLLTSNEPYAAQETWGPLHGLPRDSYLWLFTQGLCHLIRDEFDEAIARLNEGIEKNADNGPLNADMRLIIDQIGDRRSGDAGTSKFEEEPVSAAQILLQQASFKATRH